METSVLKTLLWPAADTIVTMVDLSRTLMSRHDLGSWTRLLARIIQLLNCKCYVIMQGKVSTPNQC